MRFINSFLFILFLNELFQYLVEFGGFLGNEHGDGGSEAGSMRYNDKDRRQGSGLQHIKHGVL